MIVDAGFLGDRCGDFSMIGGSSIGPYPTTTPGSSLSNVCYTRKDWRGWYAEFSPSEWASYAARGGAWGWSRWNAVSWKKYFKQFSPDEWAEWAHSHYGGVESQIRR